jgi:hypothetical protein
MKKNKSKILYINHENDDIYLPSTFYYMMMVGWSLSWKTYLYIKIYKK